MIMKNNSETLRNQDWLDYVNAKKLKTIYPDVSSVHIRLCRILFSQTVCEYDIKPNDQVHLSTDCLNPNCTSKFILTGILEASLRERKTKVGILPCKGKESNKREAYSCSCQLEYLIEPKVE